MYAAESGQGYLVVYSPSPKGMEVEKILKLKELIIMNGAVGPTLYLVSALVVLVHREALST